MNFTKKIRIVFFTHYAELYGANRSLLNLIEGLQGKYDAEALVIVPTQGKFMDLAVQKGIKCICIPFYNEIYFQNRSALKPLKAIFKFFYNWSQVIRYSSRLKGYDIVHSNSSATLIGAYFSYRMKIPHVWHIREFGWEDYKMKYYFGRKYFQYWLNKSDVVVAISKAIYEKRVVGILAKKKSVIHNGIIFEHELKQAMKAVKSPASRKIYAIVGLICPEKNQLEAIEAFILLQQWNENAELWIAGTGEDEYVALLKQKVKENGLEEKVKFTGFIDNISSVYEYIDCLLMCSKHEALGRVTIEAMARGITVIGYNNGGTIEIITDNYNGLLYSNGAPHLFEKMKYLFENVAMINEMRINGFETVSRDFTIERCSQAVFELYDNIIE